MSRPAMAACVQMEDELLLLERQRLEPVRIELHDGRIVHSLEQVLAVRRRLHSRGGGRRSKGVR